MVFEASENEVGLNVILVPLLNCNVLCDSVLHLGDLKIVLDN